uniref:MOTHER OF FT AND TFL1 n=1 Tax=Symplocarpus renifolius TaxID=477955 RepID=A0A1B4XBF4_9ARAE|nr:MOTHER OF FT AND TFL1 [Symplocarpus renifolius]
MRIAGGTAPSTTAERLSVVVLVSAFASLSLLLPVATSRRSQLDALVAARVIPDVIDAFSPAAEVSARYGRRDVVDGCDIKPSESASRPAVWIRGRGCSGDNLYTLIMTDPDAPSPSNPSEREWLHWIVVDIPGECNAAKGKELVPYMGPEPPIGIHRYVFVVFKQNKTLGEVRPPLGRGHFKTRGFAAQNGLGLPVAALYFNATKEPAIRIY